MFEQITSKIEYDTEKYMFEMDLETQDDPKKQGLAKNLDKCIKIISLLALDDKYTDIVYEENSIPNLACCNKPKSNFMEYINKKVRVIGASYFYQDKEQWIISSLIVLNDNEEDILTCGELDEEYKRHLLSLIKNVNPSVRHDLITKAVKVAKKAKTSNQKVVYYNTNELIITLYNIISPVMQPEMRSEFERLYSELNNTSLSKEEKANYNRIMKEIVSIDWAQTRIIPDIRVIEGLLKNEHLGHDAQIMELLIETKACITMHEVHKSINFVGRTGSGKNSLAIAYAKSLEMPYAIIDMAGVKAHDSDELKGSSRIYQNGTIGSIFQKIKEVGPYGTLILKNIDQYDINVLNIFQSIILKGYYTDGFIDVPFDTSGMVILCTSHSVKKIPAYIRAATAEINLDILQETEIEKIVNEKFLPHYCKKYGLNSYKTIDSETMHTLIYKYCKYNMHKIKSAVREIVLSATFNDKKDLSFISLKDLESILGSAGDYYSIRNTYVREFSEMERKFFMCYDEYPIAIRDYIMKNLDYISLAIDEKKEPKILEALGCLVNIFNGNEKDIKLPNLHEYISKSHYGMGELIDKFATEMFIRQNENEGKGMTVIGLNGAPGVGKTTIASKFAEASGREFVKISLGGLHGAEIFKGSKLFLSHIMLELSKTGRGAYNSVILLDEVDKLDNDGLKGLNEFIDPSLDSFYEEYLECFIPKNNFIIILTYNDANALPRYIRSRITEFTCTGYSLAEKKEIILRYKIPSLENKYGTVIEFPEEALDFFVREYCISSGIRELEKILETIVAKMIWDLDSNMLSSITITKADILRIQGSGKAKLINDIPLNTVNQPGQVQALAVMGSIGTSFAIQTIENKYQKEDLKITGLPKGSALESVYVAAALASKQLNIQLPKLHVHFTDPSVEKDGASAGISIFISIMSCLLRKAIPNVCFTGTIDVYGNIGAIGGIEEKISAAERNSSEKVYIPIQNYELLTEKANRMNYAIEIVPVNTIDDLIDMIFGGVHDAQY